MNPTNPKIEVVKGVQCFLNEVIQAKQDGPTKTVLISLFIIQRIHER